MKKSRILILGLAGLIALSSCQTTKKAVVLVPAAESGISTEAQGFSPRAEAGRNAIVFDLFFGNPESVQSWKVEIMSAGRSQKSFEGLGSGAPATLAWDGMAGSGNPAPEGVYTALLSIAYADTYADATSESASFILDTTAPAGRLILAQADLVPGGKGFLTPASIMIDASSSFAEIESWSLDILDPSGRTFRSYSGKWPQKVVAWDGLSFGGAQATPVSTYRAIARVRDGFGNTGGMGVAIPVGDIPSASGSTLIEARYAGFAPKGESSVKTMDFTLGISQKDAVKAWRISIAQGDFRVRMTDSGYSGDIPSSYSWDGKTNSGIMAAEGRYTATLFLDYGTAYKPAVVKSKSFVLDLTPPSGTIISNPPHLTLDGEGGLAPMTFTVIANSELSALDVWSFKLLGSDGRAVLSAEGRYPQSSYTWDGKVSGGAVVDPTVSYALEAKVTDRYGNAGRLTGSLGLAEIPTMSATVAISPGSAGFSPNGDGAMDGLSFALLYGQPQAVKAWKVDILDAGLSVRTFKGDSSALPAEILWDGKKGDGTPAEEGSYTAALDVDYGNIFLPIAVSSEAFMLALTPPEGQITLSEPLFSPIESNPELTVSVEASSKFARMDSWSMRIFDPAGNFFMGFEGQWPDNEAVWDGSSLFGGMVESAEDYSVAVTVRDEFGNSALLRSTIPVDILVEKTATGYRILSSRIFFKSFTADYVDVTPELAGQNVLRLDQLAAKLKKFSAYRIKIVGHAVMINWDDPAKGKAEQEQVLIPLSVARASAIATAMAGRGFDRGMIDTQGVGAADQLVSDGDLANRWRNRRVAFFLERP